MPIYEFQCSNCFYKQETFERINSEKRKVCPKCRQYTLERIISKNTFILKGKGWTGNSK